MIMNILTVFGIFLISTHLPSIILKGIHKYRIYSGQFYLFGIGVALVLLRFVWK